MYSVSFPHYSGVTSLLSEDPVGRRSDLSLLKVLFFLR